MDEVRPREHPPQTLRTANTEFILSEVRRLREEVPADPDICVGIFDGPAELIHPCFRGAWWRCVDSLVAEGAGGDRAHVPVAVSRALAVGALGRKGRPSALKQLR